ncbi:hypothetical protein PEC301645_23300 [Pectobacterium carotovorum subsp. carotovorum]|nr:hypothetical protein PEC301645_23300 [Pectobacterium carotovorum subsp. carotovorum]
MPDRIVAAGRGVVTAACSDDTLRCKGVVLAQGYGPQRAQQVKYLLTAASPMFCACLVPLTRPAALSATALARHHRCPAKASASVCWAITKYSGGPGWASLTLHETADQLCRVDRPVQQAAQMADMRQGDVGGSALEDRFGCGCRAIRRRRSGGRL